MINEAKNLRQANPQSQLNLKETQRKTKHGSVYQKLLETFHYLDNIPDPIRLEFELVQIAQATNIQLPENVQGLPRMEGDKHEQHPSCATTGAGHTPRL